jgi:hypothetical protein
MLPDLFASVKNSFDGVRGLAVRDFNEKMLPATGRSLMPPGAQGIAESYQADTERRLVQVQRGLTEMIAKSGGVRLSAADFDAIKQSRKLDEAQLDIRRDGGQVFVKAPKDEAGKVPFLESALSYPDGPKPENGPPPFEFAKLMLGMIASHLV